jgi:hypothetical protein
MLIKLITHAKTFAFVYATQNHPGNWFLLVSSGEKKVSRIIDNVMKRALNLHQKI